MMLIYAHSGIRYLVLLIGLAVVAYALYGAVTKKPFTPSMRVLGGVYAMSMDVNILLGLALIFTNSFQPYLIGHITMMVFAAAAGHVVPAVMKRRPEEERTYLPYVVGTVISLGLLVAGILAIPGAQIFGSRYS